MATTISGTPIGDEIDRILSNKTKLPMRHLKGTIHLLDVKIDVECVKILSFDIIRDYEGSYADETTVTVVFPRGTYKDIIYPNKENIEFTIETTPVEKDKKDNIKYEDNVQSRYIAKFITQDSPSVKGEGTGVMSTDALDISEFVTIDIQLIDKAVYLFRMVECGTIARQLSPKDFIQTFLTQQVSNLQLSGEQKIIGIDLIDPDNTGKQEQIIIPHGTTLESIPDYVQKRCCGIYNKGLSSYVQNRVWYIYPRHDIDRSPKADRYITIIVIPPKVMPTIEKSWRKDGEHWKILCTGRLQLDNNANNTQLNDGTGARFSSAVTPLTLAYPSRSGNTAILSKKQLNTEEMYKLKGKEQIAPYRSGYFTANAFKETSYVSSLNSALLSCVWENSYPRIIVPGTLAKILYLDQNGTTIELKGIVMKAQHSTQLPNDGLIQNTWITNTALFIWCKNDLDTGNAPPKEVKGGAKGWMKGAGSGGDSAMSLSSLFGGNY